MLTQIDLLAISPVTSFIPKEYQDDAGVVRVDFPQRIEGYRDFKLLAQEVQLAFGTLSQFLPFSSC